MKIKLYIYKDKCDTIETEWIYDDEICHRSKSLVYHQSLNSFVRSYIKFFENHGVEVEVLSGNAT